MAGLLTGYCSNFLWQFWKTIAFEHTISCCKSFGLVRRILSEFSSNTTYPQALSRVTIILNSITFCWLVCWWLWWHTGREVKIKVNTMYHGQFWYEGRSDLSHRNFGMYWNRCFSFYKAIKINYASTYMILSNWVQYHLKMIINVDTSSIWLSCKNQCLLKFNFQNVTTTLAYFNS